MNSDAAVAVLGGGSWGTALAWLLAEQGRAVRLWTRDPELAAVIRTTGENERYLPGVRLPQGVWPTPDLEAALEGTTLALLAVPAQALREAARRALPLLPPESAVLLAAKGIELNTGKRMSEVLVEEGLRDAENRLAVLSGPNLADEIVRKLPTVSVVASRSAALAARLQEILAAPFFRVYVNTDLTGVELGGALKNPIAVAAGISDGLGFENNTKAALLTRGLAEITRLGVACGARAETFAGLSGLGDLMATAHSPLSRNYRLGLALGRGTPLAEALAELGHVAEGVATAAAACALAERLGVELPITCALREVLADRLAPAEAVRQLMTRAYREEG